MTEAAINALMFPTYVGMNRIINSLRSYSDNVPHIRGDEPHTEIYLERLEKCSPHTWRLIGGDVSDCMATVMFDCWRKESTKTRIETKGRENQKTRRQEDHS